MEPVEAMKAPSTTPPPEQMADELKARWAHFRQEHPDVRIRDAADVLGTSEAQLLATDCGTSVVRLSANWGEFLQKLTALGPVMALTRNDDVVHEKTGIYDNITIQGKMGLVLNHDIDLRIFLSHWHLGFAVMQEVRGKIRNSFQFFDQDGTAIHKIYLTNGSNETVFTELVKQYADDNQSPWQSVTPLPLASPETPDDQIDIKGFWNAWDGLKDVHEFFGVLRQFNLSRSQAFRLAGIGRAYQVKQDSLEHLFYQARDSTLPIMVFVGNSGVIQIHTGPINKLKKLHEWFNVLDPDFNLHLKDGNIDQLWVVKKPTADGLITSLELFNESKTTMAMLFGQRAPGEPESPQWRSLVGTLPSLKP